MNRLFLNLNGLLFDRDRGIDRIAITLLVVAVIAGLAGDRKGFLACMVPAVLLGARRAT
jgi:hypothetical protein